MSTFNRRIVLLILFLNGVGAFAAGYLFISDPSGHSIGMSREVLQYSPFSDFLIPGIVMILALGLVSTISILMLILNHPYGAHYIMLEGILLTGWIFVQVVMLRMIHPMHLLMGAAGIILIYISFQNLYKRNNAQKKQGNKRRLLPCLVF